jgi:esterase/lipase
MEETVRNLSAKDSAYFQSYFNQDAETIEAWFEVVCKAYPYLHSFSFSFLNIAMGGLFSALEAGITAKDWAVMTARNNSHLLDEN